MILFSETLDSDKQYYMKLEFPPYLILDRDRMLRNDGHSYNNFYVKYYNNCLCIVRNRLKAWSHLLKFLKRQPTHLILALLVPKKTV